MNKFTVKGNYNVVAGKLKQKFANLTDDYSLYRQGLEEEILGGLQRKFGQSMGERDKLPAKL